MRPIPAILLLIATAIAFQPCGRAAEADGADLRLKLKNAETMHYAWTITSHSVSNGREQGKPFTLGADFVLSMTLQLKGLAAKGESTPVSIRLQNINYTRKQSIGDDKTDLVVSREKVRYSENGKVLVDSENDIGHDYINQFLDDIKVLESGEAHSLIDGSGRQTLMEGDSALVEMFRSGGAHAIFPLLAGKSVTPGESWEDTFELPKIGEFKLAKPAVIRSKMTFARWELKNGRKLAQIEMASAMEHADLKGENPKGMLAEISHVNDMITGTCLFDPATGRFVEGSISNDVKYHIDGEQDQQRTGLDVAGKSTISFALKEK
jgi:hypothetical protein